MNNDEIIQRLKRLANNFFSDKVEVSFRNQRLPITDEDFVDSGIQMFVGFEWGGVTYVFDREGLDNNFEGYANYIFERCVLALAHKVFVRGK